LFIFGLAGAYTTFLTGYATGAGAGTGAAAKAAGAG
jgi:hypothetical protein